MLAVQRSDSSRRVFLYLYMISDQDGLFELDAAKIAEQTGLSRKTVYKAIAFLQKVRLLFLEEARTGRGKHSIYKLNWRKPAQKHYPQKQERQRSKIAETADQKKCHPSLKDGIVSKTQQSKDARVASQGVDSSAKGRDSNGVKRDSTFYQGQEAEKVCIFIKARFYRQVMRAIRLSLESWALSEGIRDALEGFFGNRIDGASLAYARELKDKIWALKSKIERLAASGASPRRVISFIAGRLAGVPEKRSRREVLKRTAALISDVEHIERRIAGLRAWLKERESEYLSGLICKRCGYRHSESDYCSGHREDGKGLNCFGFARIKLEELEEQRKLAERYRRDQLCRQCGGSLRGGHVEGLCWSCYDREHRDRDGREILCSRP